jgi:hypothetical protein
VNRKLKWGVREILADERQAWMESDAITGEEEVLVCFTAARTEDGSYVKAKNIRSIVARRDA